MSYSGRRIVRNTLMLGLRMTLRYKFIIFGFILGLSLMFSISIPYDSSDENITNLGECQIVSNIIKFYKNV